MASINERLSLVFGSLNTSLKPVSHPPLKEEPTQDHSPTDKTHRRRRTRSRNDTTISRDRSPRRRGEPRQPEYMRHPKKWTRYNLDDDGSQHSAYKGLNDEQINRKAALDFIHKLRQDKTTTSVDEKSVEPSDKIVFKKPIIRPQNKHTDHPTNRGGGGVHYEGTIHKMPEYFVGLTAQKSSQKPPKSSFKVVDKDTSCSNNKKSCQIIQLSHLEDGEDD